MRNPFNPFYSELPIRPFESSIYDDICPSYSFYLAFSRDLSRELRRLVQPHIDILLAKIETKQASSNSSEDLFQAFFEAQSQNSPTFKELMHQFSSEMPASYVENLNNELHQPVLGLIFILFGLLFFTLCFFVLSPSSNKNLLKLLFIIELLSLNFSLIFLFVDFNCSLHQISVVHGQTFVLFFLTISALEASIGLAFIYNYFRFWRNINIKNLNKLKS